MLEFAAPKNIFGIWKGGNPLPIEPLGIPSHVIHMQVGIDHQRDILWVHTSLCQPIQVGLVQLMKPLKQGQGTRLSVAASGIDQDHMLIGANQPRVHAGH